MIPRPVCLLITKPSVLCLRRVLYPVRIKVSSPHWSIYCAANFPGASRSVFIWSPANWSAMISTMVCVNSAGVVNRLRSLTPLPRPTTSGQRRRSSPCLLIWICPSRCVTTACTSPAAYPGRRTPPRKLSRWRTR